jgi:cell division septation protein DedD
VTVLPTPTITATVVLTPLVEATTTATVVAVTATPAVVAVQTTPEEAEQEVADQPVLKMTPFHVQVGVYSRRANVLKTERSIQKAGYQYYVVKMKRDAFTVYKVRVGNFANRSIAEKIARILAKKTKEKAIVVEE